MISLPGSTQKWTPTQTSDLFGNVIATKNIDFDKLGYLALAKRAMVLHSKDDDSDFGNPLAISADSTNTYILTTANVFTIDLTSLSLTTVLMSGAPTVGSQSDMESFQGAPHITGPTVMASYDTDLTEWTTQVDDLSASYPHPLCRHGGRQTLVVADGNVLRQYDTSYTRDTDNELTLPSEYVIEWVRYRQSTLYIGTRNIAGGNASLFVWTGSGINNNGEYGVLADWIYSGCEYKSSIACITSTGQILVFNGAGFSELANFPVYYTDQPWTSDASTANLVGNVASRGMAALGSVLLININGAVNLGQGEGPGPYLQAMPSGLWECDPNVGLYHKSAPNYGAYQELQPTEVASGFLVFSSDHQTLTGDAVLCVNHGAITGTVAGQTYYAIVGSSKTLQLALSPADAYGGRAIPLSGTPNTFDLFAFETYSTMGATQITSPGTVYIPSKKKPSYFFGTQFLYGANVSNASGTSTSVLMSPGMGRNRGYFITPKISSANVMDTYQHLIAKFSQLNLDSQSIIIKYRSSDRFGVPNAASTSGNSIQFTSSTTFTVDTTIKDFKSVQMGDEVEFITGAAAGYLAHITAIDATSSTYIITIDEELPVSSGDKTDCVAQNWTKGDTITNASKNNLRGWDENSIDATATWVQFKVELRGAGVMLQSMQIINAPNQSPS